MHLESEMKIEILTPLSDVFVKIVLMLGGSNG